LLKIIAIYFFRVTVETPS